MKKSKIIIIITAAPVILSQVLFLAIYLHVHSVANRYIVEDIGKIPAAYACIVLGAAVYEDGRISDVLHDRLMKALDLYRAGKVKKILLSGDHSTFEYNEVRQMRDFMVRKGVPPGALVLDHGGFNTHSSMVRARRIFNIDDCIVVTQRFHLHRALYIARRVGLRAWGYPADRRRYLYRKRYAVREYLACVKAFLDLLVDREPQLQGRAVPLSGGGPSR